MEFAALISFWAHGAERTQDTVAVNEIVHAVQRDWGSLVDRVDDTGLDYVVLDAGGTVRYRTRPGLSESVNVAVAQGIRC